MALLLFELFLLILGFLLLIKSSDLFVDSVSSIASHFKMSKMTIALTVAAFGTCAPEIAISFNSMISGNGDMALSNVLGSSVVNILLIIGIACMIFPIKVKDAVVKKELTLLVAITTFFSFFMITNLFEHKNGLILTRVDALLLLLVFLVFMFYIISVVKTKSIFEKREKPKYGMFLSIFLTLFCIGGIILGSNMVVEYASLIAEYLGISQKIITMTVIVIGTSLPELTITVLSAKKKEFDIALGNIIGTNIFNIGIVLAVPVLIYGDIVSFSFTLIDAMVVLGGALLLYLFSKNDRYLSRKEGIVMFIIFILYYVYLFIQ